MNSPAVRVRLADKKALLKILDAQEGRDEATPRPRFSAEEVRRMMIADGIRPEENEFSREIIRARYGGEE